MDTTQNNPLFGMSVGSTIDAATGKSGESILRGKVTNMSPQTEQWKTMRGESSFVYSKSMNQASTSVSGSFGIDGISKSNATFSAYVGQSAASADNSIKLSYEILICAGTENIDFDNLQVVDLINSLAAGPKQMILDALDKFNALNSVLVQENADLGAVMSDRENPKYKKVVSAFDEWHGAVYDFEVNYFDGLVVKVAWGGFGRVTLDIKSSSSDTSWRYGGSANYSYTEVGQSATVGASYDGNQSNGKADVKVTDSHFFSGECVKDQTNKWFDQVSGKSFEALANVNVLNSAPDFTASTIKLSQQEFVKPKADKKVDKAAEKIKSLHDLDKLAQASAYEKAKKESPELLFKDFLKQAQKAAKTKPLKDLSDKIKSNDVSTLAPSTKKGAGKIKTDVMMTALESSILAEPADTDAGQSYQPPTGYTPVGVWIANWSELFPWLATGYFNSVDSTDKFDPIIKYRVMQQDLLTLSKIYYIAAGCKLVSKATPHCAALALPNLLEVADSFSNAQIVNAGKVTAEECNQAINDAFKKMSTDAQKIYTHWDQIGFLRDAELGLGVMIGKNSLSYPMVSRSDYVVFSHGGLGESHAWHATLEGCSFVPKIGNFPAFADFYKLLPLVLPDGTIVAFGPKDGIFSLFNAQGSTNFEFSPQVPSGHSDNDNTYLRIPVLFKANTKDKVLEGYNQVKKLAGTNTDIGTVKMYPVPFSAAAGVKKWMGQSVSTNVASMSDLNDQLSNVIADLSKLQEWTLSSSSWDKDWDSKKYYKLESVKRKCQYVGLVDESIFNSKR
jgi:hypothetical protein